METRPGRWPAEVIRGDDMVNGARGPRRSVLPAAFVLWPVLTALASEFRDVFLGSIQWPVLQISNWHGKRSAETTSRWS